MTWSIKNLFGKKLESTEDFKDGIPDGYGEYRIPEKGEYFGEWKDGLQEGEGKFVYSNGHEYVGTFSRNNRHGKGTYTSEILTMGGVFDADEFVYGKVKLHDHIDATGKPYIEYTGHFRNHLPNGQGYMITEFRDHIEGEFIDGEANGHCKITLLDATTYVGECKNHLPNGQGTLSNIFDHIKQVGEFRDGKIIDGTEYRGLTLDGEDGAIAGTYKEDPNAEDGRIFTPIETDQNLDDRDSVELKIDFEGRLEALKLRRD